MNLGEMIDTLGKLDPETLVQFMPENPHSYRGYYDRLAVEPGTGHGTVRELREMFISCVGKTFTGWKGGEFTMDRHTRLHMADQGTTGDTIYGVTITADEVRLATAPEVW